MQFHYNYFTDEQQSSIPAPSCEPALSRFLQLYVQLLRTRGRWWCWFEPADEYGNFRGTFITCSFVNSKSSCNRNRNSSTYFKQYPFFSADFRVTICKSSLLWKSMLVTSWHQQVDMMYRLGWNIIISSTPANPSNGRLFYPFFGALFITFEGWKISFSSGFILRISSRV